MAISSNESSLVRGALALVWLCGALACQEDPLETASAPAGPGNPNVFVIVLDAASAFYVGVYGDTHATTPNLDALARESVVFDQAYSQSATTTPSTASYLTSTRVMTHRLNSRSVLPEQFDTVAELFGEHGYTSYAFVGNPHAGAPALGLDRGYDHLALIYESKQLRTKQTIQDGTQWFKVVLPEDFEESVFEALPGFAASDTYAYFHYLQPHKPYDAPARYARADAAESESCLCQGEPCRCGEIDWKTIHQEFMKANEVGYASPSTIGHLEARYRANLRYVDEAVGQLLGALRERDLYEDALIVVMSDHGEAFFGHKRFGHNRTLYDDMVRIPLWMKFPARAKVPPRRINALVETVDIVPTLFDYLGFDASDQWEGESLWPLIEGREIVPRPAHEEVLLATYRRDLQALRMANYKLIVSEDGKEQLYDLRSDPGELMDLAARDPERVAKMRARLDSLVKEPAGRTSPTRSTLRDDPEMDALLEALGYLRDDEDVASPRPAGEEPPPSSQQHFD